jgi:hypothetical protein
MLHRRSRTLGGSSDRAARRAVATKSGTRGSGNGAATDLLVCFPSRAHLALMPPKAICSPSCPSSASEPVKRRHSTSRAGPMPFPPSWPGLYKSATCTARNPPIHRHRGADRAPVDDEPTSPKVTCAGQIKARPPKPSGGGKKATWLQALGIKKDAMALLDALHGAFRFNVAGCFGSFPGAAGVAGYTSGEDDDYEEEEEEDVPRAEKDTEHGGAARARWFMVLEEGNKKVSTKKLQGQEPERSQEEDAAPPANALMLMRCRSAPAKGLARRVEAEEEREDVKIATNKTPEKETEKERESLVLMTYSPDFFKVSLDIAKETWIVGGDDAVLRCRSWKR